MHTSLSDDTHRGSASIGTKNDTILLVVCELRMRGAASSQSCLKNDAGNGGTRGDRLGCLQPHLGQHSIARRVSKKSMIDKRQRQQQLPSTQHADQIAYRCTLSNVNPPAGASVSSTSMACAGCECVTKNDEADKSTPKSFLVR